MRQQWRDEIEGHIWDCAADQGINVTEARKRFGDEQAVYHELKVIHPWLAAYGDWIVIGAILLACLPLYIGTTVFANTIPGLLAERLLVWWWGLMIILGSFIIIKWQTHLINPDRKILMIYALSTGYVISTTITTVLDVNNFETTVYNSLFSIVVGISLWFGWPKLNLNQKKILLYSAVGLLILFAWREQGWLEALIFPGCLYLQPDPLITAPSQCTQLSWLHPSLFIIYLTLTFSLGSIVRYCYLLWKHSSILYRKIITTSVFVLMPITPLLVSGVNQSGTLDVLPWKRDIYTAYVDILGRRPEQKDYDFYAQTRSYQHMSAVRGVLYQSAERRIKVQLLYEELLGRTPTPEEIDQYVNSTMTIAEIRSDLETSQ